MTVEYYTEGFRQLVENGDWASGDYRAVLVESGYTFSAAHASMTSVTNQVTDAAEADATALANRAYVDVSDGVALSLDDYTFTSVGSGATVDAVVVYAEGGGTSGTRIPLFYTDEDSTAGAISITTDGNNITVEWNGGRIGRILRTP